MSANGGICQQTTKIAFCGELQVGLGLALVLGLGLNLGYS